MAICKKEFADRMAENGGMTKTGFGRFEIRTVREKKGRNLHSGEPCIIPEHEYVGFRASDLLYDSIRERGEDDTYGNEE